MFFIFIFQGGWQLLNNTQVVTQRQVESGYDWTWKHLIESLMQEFSPFVLFFYENNNKY